MLQDIIDLQKKAVSALIKKTDEQDKITFKAPTGSGKTYIMADYINQTLTRDKDVVFLVSTLSKGDLASQNYEKFCQYKAEGYFNNLKPYLINTEVSSEERLFIPIDCNVYILPRDLYKKGGKLMQGAMENFLKTLTLAEEFNGLGKKIFLIKDECHIATNNLDNLNSKIFTKILNFSATPNSKKGQHPDVEITDDEAVNVKLIKHVEWEDEQETVSDAIEKFKKIKKEYELLGVHPCLIIQISNKDKATEEWQNQILPALNENQDIKWMLIVNKEKDCDTNDEMKAKKLPVKKWKDYAKLSNSTIDVIIFKMVISEGWDIPRACMLYQIRDSKSKQLDEQVIGRVRRNPRLKDFEKLTEASQNLATTAWVWGIRDEEKIKTYSVKLWDESTDITDNIKIRTTRLKPLKQKKYFNIENFINSCATDVTNPGIFALYKELKKAQDSVQELCNEYSTSYQKWWEFTQHLKEISKESNKFYCNYKESMELVKTENGDIIENSFAINSYYTDNGNYENISDWVWRRKDGIDKFAFDSDAEREWASILKDLSLTDIENESCKVTKKIIVGKHNPKAGQKNIFNEIEPDKVNAKQKYLWGKNYIPNSLIKFEYYLDGVHSSYPDFVLKDCYDRIHVFEVKSVNKSNSLAANIDEKEYKKKINELEKCYTQASLLTGYLFYLPILREGDWQITKIEKGKKRTLTKEQFNDYIKKII